MADEDRMTTRVTERTILLRINQKLAKKKERLSRQRSSGEYRHVDTQRQALLSSRVNLESFARDLGVLDDEEEMVRES